MKKKISLTIDGKKVEAQEGMTILEAAKSAGIEIPHLCYLKDLPGFGACRLCLVEVEGVKEPVASCAFKVAPKMAVRTQTPLLSQIRKVVLELLLSDHSLDCVTCEKCGDCRLQDYAYQYGVSKSRFEGERHNYPVDDTNPFFIRDYNKCILCGKCVRACNQIEFDFAIDFERRGFNTKVAAPFDGKLQEGENCTFCGQCVGVCPTSSLLEKQRIGKGRIWEFKKVRTICPYCGCGCGVLLWVKDNQIVNVTADEKSVVNRGNLCVKGRFGLGFVNHPERLTSPLIRKGKEFVEVSWEEALDFVAKRLKQIKSKYGANSVACLASAKCTNEENYLMQKFARAVIGTNNIDHCARLCHAPSVTALAQAFGSGAMTNPISDILEAEVILVTGSNTTEAHPIVGIYIKKSVVDKGAKLIVIDPRKIRLVDFAEVWLSQRPGTDVAVFNGLAHVILRDGLVDEDFIKERTENFESLAKVLKKYTPVFVERISGVAAELIEKAAHLYGEAERASIIYAMGITQHTTGHDNVLSIANLAMMTGNVGKRGTGVNPLRGQNNVQGACDMGALPNVFSGYQKVDDAKSREKFEKAWDRKLPKKPGLTVVEMFKAAEEGKIKAMYIMGENPVLSDPDISNVKKALEKLDFLVVQDIFLSETARFADVVLPSASFAEKDGTFTNTERRIQKLRKAIEPPGEARADWEIICDLAERMGYPMKYSSPAEIMIEVASLTPICCGVRHERLGEEGLCWPCPDLKHPGTPRLHIETFSRGLGYFSPVEFKPPAEEVDRRYPLILTTGRILYHYHTGTMSRRSNSLNQHVPEGSVEVNPKDAKRLRIRDGQLVYVKSRRGKTKAKVRVTEKSSEGTIFMPFHFVEAPANILTSSSLDPVAKIPELKVCAARIEKIKS